ncbi:MULTISPECIES: hypothetical protein [unclassified Variovorax]|uniref:hypothetical protein n=1 Tax=unclassified Variovorax TaxID=663243 RepID=UPI000C424198|nr:MULTISPECIES: hypothetical protein [Variovorax]PIF76838.1 hypothetical protein CLU95_4007 [Variovorax sp. 54]QOF79524.1 hypothetical protein IG196_03735 [Variovorax sp. 38R]WPG38675.1 hypothetical protein RZE79_04895 [Variovorax boronicumulans]
MLLQASLPTRLLAAFLLACTLSACGGSDNNGGGFPPIITPPPQPQPETGVKPEMRCAP